jgi:hypothetical protein
VDPEPRVARATPLEPGAAAEGRRRRRRRGAVRRRPSRLLRQPPDRTLDICTHRQMFTAPHAKCQAGRAVQRLPSGSRPPLASTSWRRGRRPSRRQRAPSDGTNGPTLAEDRGLSRARRTRG